LNVAALDRLNLLWREAGAGKGRFFDHMMPSVAETRQAAFGSLRRRAYSRACADLFAHRPGLLPLNTGVPTSHG
jgi:hypothetical protein